MRRTRTSRLLAQLWHSCCRTSVSASSAPSKLPTTVRDYSLLAACKQTEKPASIMSALRSFTRRYWHSPTGRPITVYREAPTTYVDAQGYQHFQQRRPWYHLTYTHLLVMGGMGVGVTAYYFACREEVPYTHRKHSIMLVSRAGEQRLGRMIFEQQKLQAELKGALVPASNYYAQAVRRVGERIAQVAADGAGGGNFDHMKNLKWEYMVVNSPIPNAFVVPGGKVVVFTGLLKLLSTDDELAYVLGHETAHVLARHHGERISSMNVFNVLDLVVRLLFGFGIPNVTYLLGVFLPYSRRAEHEADAIGLRLMARACYDPKAATTALRKLNAAEKQMGGAAANVPTMLRTHPLTEKRVDEVSRQLPEAYKMYEAAGCATVKGYMQEAWDAMHAAVGPGLPTPSITVTDDGGFVLVIESNE